MARGLTERQTRAVSAALSPPRRGPDRARDAFVWPWLLVSAVVHAMVMWTGFAMATASGRMLAEGRGDPLGHGFGGDAVDFVIAGPEAETPRGDVPMAEDLTRGAVEVAPVAPEETAESPERPLEAETSEVPSPPTRDEPRQAREAVAARDPVEARPGNSREESRATDATEPGAVGEDEQVAGTGGEESTSGALAGGAGDLILGSIGAGGDLAGARRALMPDMGMCEDPVAGTWRAQRYDAGSRRWVRFTLVVRHDGSGALTGTITHRGFTGSPGNSTPGPCTAFGHDMTYRMNARGRFTPEGHRGSMTFEARNARLLRADCPDSGSVYFPDRFRGTVDPMRDRYDAVNNDGRVEFDQPYTFRRVACE